jgi:hypothetical protein
MVVVAAAFPVVARPAFAEPDCGLTTVRLDSGKAEK